MKKRTIAGFVAVVVLAGAALCGTAHAQEATTPVRIGVELSDHAAFSVMGQTVTLGRAIEMVLEQNRDTLAGAYDVAMADSLYRKYQGKYSTNLSLSGSGKHQEFPEGAAILNGYERKTWNLSAAVAKMFQTGTTVSAGLTHDYVNADLMSINMGGVPMTLGQPVYHQPVMFASVKQELLRNAFGFGERREQEILKNQGKMQRDSTVYLLAGLVVGVVVDYWTVIINGAALENAELQLRETKRVRNIIAANVRIGLADAYDLNYYNTLVANSEARAVSGRQAYRDAVRNLLRTLNLDEKTDLSGRALLAANLPRVDVESSLKSAFERRADYNNALLAVKNAELSLDIHRNDGLPSVTAEVNVSSLGQQREMGEAYGDTTGMSYPAVEGKVALTYAFDNQTQKTNVRDARFQREQARLQLDKYRRVVRDEVVGSVERIGTRHQLYQKAKEATRESEVYYDRLLANLRRGRLNAAVVKNGLDAMVASRQQELEALVQYNVSLLQLDLATNSLFERFNINVDKYIPK